MPLDKSKHVNPAIFDPMKSGLSDEMRKKVMENAKGYAERMLVGTSIEQEAVISLDGKSIVFAGYAELTYAEMRSETSYYGTELPLALDEWVNYLKTFLSSRISHCNYDSRNIVVYPSDYLRIPAFFELALEQIGRVTDELTGKTLVPKFEAEDDWKPLTIEQCKDISRRLAPLETRGFSFSKGYIKDRKGSWEFMSMEVLNGVVRALSRDYHGLYAMFAGLLHNRGISAVMTPQINYGTMDAVRRMVIEHAQEMRS